MNRYFCIAYAFLAVAAISQPQSVITEEQIKVTTPLVSVRSSTANTVVETHAATQVIEVERDSPIEFKIDKTLKEGWEKTDKVAELENDFVIPDHVQLREAAGITFAWAPPGQYVLSGKQTYINWTKQDFFKRSFEIRIVVRGEVEPQPPQPPEPPTPDANNPFKNTQGLKVLIIEEQEARQKLATEKPEQFKALTSTQLRTFLDSNCAKDSTGQPEWRLYDQDTVFNTDSEWKKAIQLPHPTLPWIIISDGKKWESVAFPNNLADTMTLLKKYASNPAGITTQLEVDWTQPKAPLEIKSVPATVNPNTVKPVQR